MARGRREHDWGQTSEVLAMLFNANRGEKSPVKKPDDFNPYRRRVRNGKPRPVAEADVDILRVFVDGKLPTDVLSKIALTRPKE